MSMNQIHARSLLNTAVYILILVVSKTGFRVPFLEGGRPSSCQTQDEIILPACKLISRPRVFVIRAFYPRVHRKRVYRPWTFSSITV